MKSNVLTSFSFKEKYDAIVRRDSSFEGAFFTAVKTTGIFCRPVCTARKPKPENVIFYDSVKEALQNGFRPCKVCRPLENSEEMPVFIADILKKLEQEPFKKIKDYELKQSGIDPAQIRRWFKKHHNLTFHAYQRMLRINNAFNKISEGESITGAAYDTGYESLSGFNEGFISIFGKSPGRSKDKTIINIVRFSTPLGPMFGCATTKGICLLEFTDRRMLETEFKQLTKLLDGVILPGNNPHLEQLQVELSEYFERKRQVFSISLDAPGSAFQQEVWNALKEIPYGKTCSYKEQALKMGKLKAIRAIASANGCNRISIIIPCHRVIGENGDLTGYGGGLARKKWLLDLERETKQGELFY